MYKGSYSILYLTFKFISSVSVVVTQNNEARYKPSHYIPIPSFLSLCYSEHFLLGVRSNNLLGLLCDTIIITNLPTSPLSGTLQKTTGIAYRNRKQLESKKAISVASWRTTENYWCINIKPIRPLNLFLKCIVSPTWPK